jgi:ABC-type multidrug transport system fused ATPase/permease subunit
VAGLVESASIVSLAPVVDFLINPDLNSASDLTKKFANLIRSLGLPVTLMTMMAFFLALTFAKSILTILTRYTILRADFAIVGDLMIETFRDFLNARWYFFSITDQGKLLNALTRQAEYAGHATRTLGLLFAAAIQLVLFMGLTLYISWQVTLVCLAAAVIFAGPFALADKASRRLGQGHVSTSNEMISLIHESLGAAKLILGFGNSAKTVDSLGDAFQAYRNVAVRSMTLSFAVPNLYQPLGFVVVMVGLMIALRLSIPLSETAILLFALMKATGPISQIVSEKNNLSNFLPSYENLEQMTASAKELRQLSGKILFESFEREIVLEQVSFTYPGRGTVLANIDATIPKGKMIAFVGASGAGKSTLIDMVMGFNNPSAGRITIDGTPLQEFDIISYRKRIGYVPQDSTLFNMSIRDNLLWSNQNASEEEIIRACRQANADNFINRLPQRYDTQVGDRGVRLSGGQVQRVALARAIIRNPELLILDEATSSLDAESERLIQKAIDSIAKETTVIVVAHRLATIAKADYIYVMEQGKIMEEGSYLDLVRARGHFTRMVDLQKLEAVG